MGNKEIEGAAKKEFADLNVFDSLQRDGFKKGANWAIQEYKTRLKEAIEKMIEDNGNELKGEFNNVQQVNNLCFRNGLREAKGLIETIK